MSDEKWMRYAIALADKAKDLGEIPVGAVIVKDDEVVAEGYNLSICQHDPSAHAEMLAIRSAGEVLENYRLIDCTLYVTLEPCPMCAGALVHSRIKRVVFGAYDEKTGAAGTVMNLVQDGRLNHQCEVTGGVLQDACSTQISDFFKARRKAHKAKKQAQKLAASARSALE